MAATPLTNAVMGIPASIFTYTVGDLLTPAKRSLHYSINKDFPNELPGIGNVITAWNQGILDDQMMTFASYRLGVSLPKPRRAGYEWEYSLWKAVSKAHLAAPNVGEIIRAGIEGVITDDAETALLKRAGASIRHYNLIRSHYYSWMDEGNLAIARNRKVITPDAFKVGLRRLGLDHNGLDSVYDTLRNAVPGSGEALRYAALGIFDFDTTFALGLFDGKPVGLEDIFNANGLYTLAKAMPNSHFEVRDSTIADLAWAAHWSTLGVNAIATMMQRFRQDRVNRFGADGLNVNPFDTQAARLWMKRNAMPPSMIDNVIASSFRPLDRRVLMFGMTAGEIQDNEAREILLDSGLASRDADRFVDIIHARIDYQNAAPIRAIEHNAIARTFQVAKQSYDVGTIDRLGFINTLTNIGVSQDAAETHASAMDAELQNRRFASILKAIKRDYLNGAMNPLELSSILSQSGIAVERQNQYITEWGALRTLERRTASTEKILAWYVQGIMTQDGAYNRLKNLGWSDVDSLAYIAEASLRIVKRDASIQQAGFRTAKANAAQLDRLQREALSQAKQMQAEIRRLTPAGRLIKWYRQGSISEVYFENRLRSMGYPDDVIAEYFLEAQKDGPLPKPAKQSPQQPSIPASNATSGTVQGETGTPQGTTEQTKA